MNSIAETDLPNFGGGRSTTTIKINPDLLMPQRPTEGQYRGSRSLASISTVQPTWAIYRVLIRRSGVTFPEIYVGKTTNMQRRVADYLEMVTRLVARHEQFDVREDKNPYRFVHYAMARAAMLKDEIEIEYYLYDASDKWKLERRELLELVALVNWCSSKGIYDHHCLNALPALTRFTEELSTPRWAEVRNQLLNAAMGQ